MMQAIKIQDHAVEIPPGMLEVSFDLKNRKEIEHAKSLYQQAKRMKRHIVVEGKDVESFRECTGGQFTIEASGHRDLGQCSLHIFDATGDRRIMWRPDRPDEVKDAAKLFQEYIKKGWKAYAIHRIDPHQRGVRVYGFDPELDEVVFDDRTLMEKLKNFDKLLGTKDTDKQTITQKLKKFVERFDEVKLLPKTYPG